MLFLKIKYDDEVFAREKKATSKAHRSEQHPTSDSRIFLSQGFHFFGCSVPSSLIKEGRMRNAKGAFVRNINEDFPADIQEG